MKKYLLATVLALGLPSLAYAQSVLQKAQQGDVEAQYDVAGNYQFGGMGFPKDIDRAKKWYKLSADKGYMFSQFQLGMLYKYTENPPNYSQARHYFKLACKQHMQSACAEYDRTE